MNGLLNETWTLSCLKFEWFSVGYGFIEMLLLSFLFSEYVYFSLFHSSSVLDISYAFFTVVWSTSDYHPLHFLRHIPSFFHCPLVNLFVSRHFLWQIASFSLSSGRSLCLSLTTSWGRFPLFHCPLINSCVSLLPLFVAYFLFFHCPLIEFYVSLLTLPVEDSLFFPILLSTPIWTHTHIHTHNHG